MRAKKRSWLRVISLALTLVLLLSCAPGAVSSNAVSAEELSEEEKLSMIAAGTMKPAEVFGELDPHTVPEAINYADAVSKNHIERLYSDEGTDLNTVVFLNIDGTKTRYTFDYPVKYVDSDGCIKDISLQITDADIGYQTAENSVMTTFSENIADGIILSDDETNIKLIPVLPVQTTAVDVPGDETYSNADYPASTATRLDDRTVQYYYDPSTTIEYSLTYTGFKEDIVVSEYTGQTQYEFVLLTNGYCVSCIDGSYYLVDENQQIRASVGEIIIFTADERNNTFGDIMVETIVEGQEYRMTILLDAEYLSDPNTAYPIRIDPTIEINYDNNGAGAIEDVTINSNAKSNGYNNVLYVGSHENDGISRILMKFPGLDLSALGDNVEIQSASVSLRDIMCESTPLEVYCHVYTGASWTEATANGTDNAPGGISTFLSSATISYEIGTTTPQWQRYNFDITKAVQGWCDGIYSQDLGIIFKARAEIESGTEYIRKTLGSYNIRTYVPILTVTYSIGESQLLEDDTYYLNNVYSGNYLTLNTGTQESISGRSGLLSDLGSSIQWEVAKYQKGYVIRSVAYPYRYLAVANNVSSDAVAVVSNVSDEIPEECFWNITLSSTGGCLIKNAYNARYLYIFGGKLRTSSSIGSAGSITYDSRVWRIISTSQYGEDQTYANVQMSASTFIANMKINVADSVLPTICYVEKEIWCSLSDFVYSDYSTYSVSVNSITGHVTGKCAGSTIVTATHKVTGRVILFQIDVEPLLVYQTRSTYYCDGDGNYAQDMMYADMSKDEILALKWINGLDFFLHPPTYFESEWKNMVAICFSKGELQEVAWDMIDHFMDGSGSPYSNQTLTDAILAHPATTEYTSSVQLCIRELLNEQSGNMSSLFYLAEDRDNCILTKRMKDKGIFNPVYNTEEDRTQGLMICVDSLWGVKIEVIQYSVSGSAYTCKLRYTFYDHFGLDTLDVEKYGFLDGFIDWFILQHYSKYDGAYKPFLTMMEFDVTFNGTYTY